MESTIDIREMHTLQSVIRLRQGSRRTCWSVTTIIAAVARAPIEGATESLVFRQI